MSGERKRLNTQRWLSDMQELKESYRMTRWNLKRALNRLVEKVDAEEEHPDIKTIRGMMTDVIEVIRWLHTGRQPGNRRGVERLAGYQRWVLLDPLKMQAFLQPSAAGSYVRLTDYERFQLEQSLSLLSDRERACYTMVHGQAYSLAKAAEVLGISKGAVDTYIQRAQAKISADMQTELVIMGRSS